MTINRWRSEPSWRGAAETWAVERNGKRVDLVRFDPAKKLWVWRARVPTRAALAWDLGAEVVTSDRFSDEDRDPFLDWVYDRSWEPDTPEEEFTARWLERRERSA